MNEIGFPLTVDSLVIASVVIVSILGFVSERIRDALVLLPYRVRTRREVYRLLTAGWVHADVTHLMFNMLTLHFFARDVLVGLGSVRFLVLYVGAVVVAFIPTTLRHMKSSQYASLGASGAVSAVMFAAILLRPTLKLSLLFIPLPIPGLLYAVGYLAYSAYRSYRPRNNINHDAHFAGAIFGTALTFAFEPTHVQRAFALLF
jgi:membrane associated rhomboid family serine protease